MLNKIKDVMKVTEEINAIKSKLDTHSESVDLFTTEMTALHAELVTLKQSQHDLLKEMQQNLGMFDSIRENLSKEVYDFKLLKGQLQKKLLDKFEEEIKQEITLNMETLRKDISDYEEMKSGVRDMLKKMELTKQEMSKWLEISTHIKATDFEMSKFARQLQQADSEKLELMRKIDSLERLVSKMRRGLPTPQMRH